MNHLSKEARMCPMALTASGFKFAWVSLIRALSAFSISREGLLYSR